MTQKKTIKYKIAHMDPMGQGVYKENDQIYFIKKSLPNEQGIAEINYSKKNLHFCESISTDTPSPDRITPECRFYNSCDGCSYLHTNYVSELNFKKDSLLKALQKLAPPTPTIFRSPNRFHYRNRIQFHFNKKDELFGFFREKSHKLVAIDQCLLSDNRIQEYTKKVLPPLVKTSKSSKGVVEIALQNDKAVSFFNRKETSFSQVNKTVNNLMIKHLTERVSSQTNLLELFCGKGNLIKDPQQLKSYMGYDVNTQKDHKLYQKVDLFHKDSFEKIIKSSQGKVDTILLDPPRSGFKELSQYADHFEPQKIIYISCNAMTLARDIQNLGIGYHLSEVSLFDMFPGTKHFETFVVLDKSK